MSVHRIEDDYTMLIPTFNRAECLRRQMGYLAAKTVQFPIIVLDSSEPDVQVLNRKACEDSALNVSYRSYSKDVEFKEKVYDGLRSVVTPYASLCTDDDIICFESLMDSVHVLRQDNSCVASHGCYVSIQRKSDNQYCIRFEYGSSLEHTGVIERITMLMLDYEPVFYAVFRTAILRDIFQYVLRVQSYMFQELFLAIAPLGNGKIKRLSSVYCVRSQLHGPAEGNIARWHPNNWLAENPKEMFSVYGEYKTVLLNYLGSVCEMVKNDSYYERVLDLVHSIYFTRNFDTQYIVNTISKEFGFRHYEMIQPQKIPFLERIANRAARIHGHLRGGDRTYERRSVEGLGMRYDVGPDVASKVEKEDLIRIIDDIHSYLTIR